MGTHVNGDLLAVGALHGGAHGLGIFGAEIEDLTDLDAARAALAFGRHPLVEPCLVVGLVGAGA